VERGDYFLDLEGYPSALPGGVPGDQEQAACGVGGVGGVGGFHHPVGDGMNKNTEEPKKVYKVWVQIELVDYEEGTEENVSEPVELKEFLTEEAAEKFVAELEDFA
jgi:hypothetical protein